MKYDKMRWLAIFLSVTSLIYLHLNGQLTTLATGDVYDNTNVKIVYWTQSQTNNIIDRIHCNKTSKNDSMTHISDGGSAKNNTFFMVILIPSMPKSSDFRHYLRRKWFNESCWREKEFQGVDRKFMNIKLMFVTGRTREFSSYSKEFLDEVSHYKDIFLMDKVESKRILKDKVLWGMKESIKHFNYTFLIKIDHDTLVDLPHLVKGIQSLPKSNLLTGSCFHQLHRGKYQRTFRYCSGGAYIITRDVVEKIAQLNSSQTNIRLGYGEPEDAYTGWLVSKVNETFRDQNVRVVHIREIVNRIPFERKYHYWFNKWFYHWLKGLDKMDKAFECRIRAEFKDCPTAYYYYKDPNSTEPCSCGYTFNPSDI